jgi:hypothetical protein
MRFTGTPQLQRTTLTVWEACLTLLQSPGIKRQAALAVNVQLMPFLAEDASLKATVCASSQFWHCLRACLVGWCRFSVLD